jgi:hypothetical protein
VHRGVHRALEARVEDVASTTEKAGGGSRSIRSGTPSRMVARAASVAAREPGDRPLQRVDVDRRRMRAQPRQW